MSPTPIDRRALAGKISRVSELHGHFVLRSGATAERYFDKYRFESDPVLLREIARSLVPLVPEGTEVLAGLELGGVPVATMLAQETGLPAVFVRKEAKRYGTAQLAEGADCNGRSLCIVEDVVTSGGQIVLSAADLRALGAKVAVALCVIDREAGGSQALERERIELRALFTANELDEARNEI
jgi:orotate phosphoribosyltransferase